MMMPQTLRWLAGSATAALVLAVAGCGGGTPPVDTGNEEVTVKGTVKILGKTATKGEVDFDPSNIQRTVAPRTAPIEKDGSYTVKTLVGKNRVTVRSPQMAKDPTLTYKSLEFEAKSGENTYDIDLK